MYNNLKTLISADFDMNANYNKILLNIKGANNKEKGKNKLYRIISVCASLLIVSSIAIAANIENIKSYFRGLGAGVETAVNNGYIAKPEMEYVKVEDIGAKVKIEDFLMDDLNLSVNFAIEFDESITNTINMDNVNTIVLSDLFIRDEENRIIYAGTDNVAFNEYCKEHNLDYKFKEFNENYMNNGLNKFIQNKKQKSLNLIYNINSEKFPKSKKLYFDFKTISISENKVEKEIQYELNGSWKVTADVPKSMYNRTSEYYKVVSCDNKDFDVYSASVTDTGFEIGVIISNIKEPEHNSQKITNTFEIEKDYEEGKISKEEYKEKLRLREELINLYIPIKTQIYVNNGDLINKISYVEDENGNKYKNVENATRLAKADFLEGDKYNFYDTFSMTKYEATNKIKVVLYYYETPVTIELEKINNKTYTY